jgi:lysophospholipase L1-like esterase
MSPQWYANNRTALIGFLHGNQIPCFDYCDLVPDRFFNDNDHMLPDGNRILATALAQAIAPQVMARIH